MIYVASTVYSLRSTVLSTEREVEVERESRKNYRVPVPEDETAAQYAVPLSTDRTNGLDGETKIKQQRQQPTILIPLLPVAFFM